MRQDSTRHPSGGLPPLAFGDEAKQTFMGVHAFGDALERSGYVVHELTAARGAGTFTAEAACVTLPSVTLLAVSSSAHRVVTERAGRVSLCFGTEGAGILSAGRVATPYHRSAAVLMPGGTVEWRIDDFASDFEVSLDRQRLAVTASGMLRLDDCAGPHGLRLDDLRPIVPRAGVIDGRSTLIDLAILAHRYRTQPRVLAASGIEDQCLRHAVLLLMPEAFQASSSLPTSGHGVPKEIDHLCEWLRANLGSPITLTDMERTSGLSARGLQLHFRRRFGMTPTEWLREQRLLVARDMLLAAGSHAGELTVAMVAEQTGFGSASLLHRRYRARFGETPRETMIHGAR